MSERCNGWTNRETWLVVLWVDNDEGLYNARLEHMKALHNFSRIEAADSLKAWVKDMVPDVRAIASPVGLWADLLGAALDRADWEAIAGHWMEETQ